MIPPSGYPKVNHAQFRARLQNILSASELENVEAAYEFSKYGHRGQLRADKQTRYFEHPKAVAWIIIDELNIIDWQLIAEALLHDIAEESYLLSPRRLRLNFGQSVANGIMLLTKRHQLYYDDLRRYGSWRELLVKCADRLQNLRTMAACPFPKQEEWVRETRQYIMPLVDLMIGQTPRRYRQKVALIKSLLEERCQNLEQFRQ